MADNSCVAYVEPGKVEVKNIDYPKLELPEQNRKCDHGVILRIVATNICGSDQHMVRGRTTAPKGQTLGHEITGEVIELGRDVEFIKKGDLVSVPFNIACGRCRMCKSGNTGVCLNVNPARPGAAYGYVDMGGWVGGQANYVMVPYADWNLLKFPDKDQAMAKIKDLTMLSDIFPTGYHGAFTAGVTTGSTVYVAGAGPVGLGVAPPVDEVAAPAVLAAGVPGRLRLGRAVVDDPDLAELVDADEDLVEVGVVGDGVEVRPVGADPAGVALVVLLGGRGRAADVAEIAELLQVVLVGDHRGQHPGAEVDVDQLGLGGDAAVVRLRLVVILDEVVPGVPLPDDLAGRLAGRLHLDDRVGE